MPDIRPPCLGCGSPLGCGSSRKNCSSCYEKLRGRVRRGSTTWAELELLGLALPVLAHADRDYFWRASRKKEVPSG